MQLSFSRCPELTFIKEFIVSITFYLFIYSFTYSKHPPIVLPLPSLFQVLPSSNQGLMISGWRGVQEMSATNSVYLQPLPSQGIWFCAWRRQDCVFSKSHWHGNSEFLWKDPHGSALWTKEYLQGEGAIVGWTEAAEWPRATVEWLTRRWKSEALGTRTTVSTGPP